MNKKNASIQSFEIKYETAPEIPPPYCYYYQVKGRVEKEKLFIEMEWVYHHREDLSLEEITDEGFSGDDDFAWKGSLDKVWVSVLENEITDTQANKNAVEADPFMEIVVEGQDGTIFSGPPLNIEEWEYLMHEFIQGIYEAAGKEAPLQIQFRKNFPDHTFFALIMTLFFKNRTVQIQTEASPSGSKQISENWEQTKSVLRDVYNLQYLAEHGKNSQPKETGSFINSGDGIWYEFTAGVKNSNKRRDTLSKLEKYFLSFGGI